MRYTLMLLSLFLASCGDSTQGDPASSTPTAASLKGSDTVIDTSKDMDIMAIKKVMSQQQEAWSNHDLEGFMQGYWMSDSLKFYGQSGLTKGWEQTLANYKKSYPTPQDTGILTFDLLDINEITPGAYWVMGRYHLQRSVGDAKGSFIVIFKNIEGSWKIIADMSAGDHTSPE